MRITVPAADFAVLEAHASCASGVVYRFSSGTARGRRYKSTVDRAAGGEVRAVLEVLDRGGRGRTFPHGLRYLFARP